MNLNEQPISKRVRRRLASACIPPFLIDVLITLVIVTSPFVAYIVQDTDWGIMRVGLLLAMTTATALLYGLPSLLAAMSIAYLGGQNVVRHPVAFAVVCVSMAPLSRIVLGIFSSKLSLAPALLMLPGGFVSFVILANSFKRIARDHGEQG